MSAKVNIIQDALRDLSPEIQGKLGQFHRILMSYTDFYQAKRITDYILFNNLYANPDRDRFLLPALNCAAIIAYCRPFSGNDPGDMPKVHDLSARFLKVLTREEMGIHEVVMQDRNTALAHSDPKAWEMEPQILRNPRGDFLLPICNDVHAPLTEENMKILQGMCSKLMKAVHEERRWLEPEMKPTGTCQPDSIARQPWPSPWPSCNRLLIASERPAPTAE